MGFMLREVPIAERPRERLVKYGPQALANYELLAILLRTGTKNLSVIDLAKSILINYENLNMLNDVTINELTKIRGIGKVKAVEIIAAIELGKRINKPVLLYDTIDTPKKAYLYVKEDMQNLVQEHLRCLYLNTKSQIIASKTISVGTINQAIIDPRDIFKWAFKFSSYAIILIHNHPSGNVEPSLADIEITKKVVKAAKTVDLLIVDHLIIGKGGYFSFQENNLLF